MKNIFVSILISIFLLQGCTHQLTMNQLVQQTTDQMKRENPHLSRTELYGSNIVLLRCNQTHQAKQLKGCI